MIWTVFWLLFGCRSEDVSKTEIDGQFLLDEDGDGFIAAEDCNDNDSSVFPGAAETCDEMDNNCDGQVDEGVTLAFYADSDGDGFGSSVLSVRACSAPEGYLDDNSDCDDNDPTMYPEADEICDNLDNNCNGEIDEGIMNDFFVDADADGYGDENQIEQACELAPGLSLIAGDCDDSNAEIHPAAEELCDGIDNNCDTQLDEGVQSSWYPDADGDGYGDDAGVVTACDPPEGYISQGGDCDDVEVYANPIMLEICDGIDNDCDGQADEAGAYGEQSFYADSDGDGYGDSDAVVMACTIPADHVDNGLDCNDQVAAIHPLASEVCDSVDNNCDGSVDEASASDATLWFYDSDGDGYGTMSAYQMACEAPTSYVANYDDCNDQAANVSPVAQETCDGIDNDCDGSIDDADSSVDTSTGSMYYADTDADGYGDGNASQWFCEQPFGYVSNTDDCNDGDGAIHPMANEVCDGVDNDCDSLVDADDADIVGMPDWYYDGDDDGYGVASMTVQACAAPQQYVAAANDCNDGNALIHPAAAEICNGLDDNCDNDIDSDATDRITWYEDLDSDNFGNSAASMQACTQPVGYAELAGDCDDGDDDVNPDAPEVCDGADNNCDGDIDPVSAVYGLGESCPASDCLDILNTLGASAVDGLYWISPDGGVPFEVACDMVTDGGGWTQVIAAESNEIANADPPDFTYNSSVWIDGYGQAGDAVHVSESWFNTPSFTEILYYEDATSYQESLSISGHLADYTNASGNIKFNVLQGCSYGLCGGRLFRSWTSAICNTGNGSSNWGAGLGPVRTCQHSYGTLYYEFSSHGVGFSSLALWVR